MNIIDHNLFNIYEIIKLIDNLKSDYNRWQNTFYINKLRAIRNAI